MNVARFLIPKVNSVYLTENQSVRQGLEKMLRHRYAAIPVLKENGEFYGCISEGDFLRHVMECGSTNVKDYEKKKIRDIMRCDFCPPVTILASIDDIVSQSQQQNFVPIVDDRNIFVGIITRKDVIKYLSELAYGKESTK